MVKEEVVESCILDEDTVVEMTLSSSLPSISTIQQVDPFGEKYIEICGINPLSFTISEPRIYKKNKKNN